MIEGIAFEVLEEICYRTGEVVVEKVSKETTKLIVLGAASLATIFGQSVYHHYDKIDASKEGFKKGFAFKKDLHDEIVKNKDEQIQNLEKRIKKYESILGL